MQVWGFGGDARMTGALQTARNAGWDAVHVLREEELPQTPGEADAVLLPWPHSFLGGKLAGTEIDKAKALAALPACRCVLHGGGVTAQEMPQAKKMLNPAQDESFLRVNAALTAEGAIALAMQREGRALLGSTCMITGFGRIAQELTVRLTALCAFVIVCARNEMQMRRAHEIGAHPVPLDQVASACAQADVIFNTVPAHVLHEGALSRIGKGTQIIELASPPYGLDMDAAKGRGFNVRIEGGLPGRYAPLHAGAALFDALLRAMKEGGESHG